MELKEYEINGDKITLDRKELERWKEHYYKSVDRRKELGVRMFFGGKSEAIEEILKLFKDED